MELLHDRGLVTSVDLAELNPFLDERGRTAVLMVDLLASLMGRQVPPPDSRLHLDPMLVAVLREGRTTPGRGIDANRIEAAPPERMAGDRIWTSWA